MSKSIFGAKRGIDKIVNALSKLMVAEERLGFPLPGLDKIVNSIFNLSEKLEKDPNCTLYDGTSMFVVYKDGEPIYICETLERAEYEKDNEYYEWADSEEVSEAMAELDEEEPEEEYDESGWKQEWEYDEEDEDDGCYVPFFEIREFNMSEGSVFLNRNYGKVVYSDNTDDSEDCA